MNVKGNILATVGQKEPKGCPIFHPPCDVAEAFPRTEEEAEEAVQLWAKAKSDCQPLPTNAEACPITDFEIHASADSPDDGSELIRRSIQTSERARVCLAI